jgi:hypothetical protein
MDRTKSASQYLGNGRQTTMNDNIAKFLYEHNGQFKMMNDRRFNSGLRPDMAHGNKASARSSYKYNLPTSDEQS